MEAPVQDFGKQDQRVLAWLRSGKTINRIEAWELLGITALNSRISTLRNKHGIAIKGEYEAGSKCKRYSLMPKNS